MIHRIAKLSLGKQVRQLGPGLITGAADDDPSGIATYSQAGAQFGFALTWSMLLTLPFMAAIQIISGYLGWQTGCGLARNISQRLSPWVLYALVALLVVANTINIAADLAVMGEAVRLVAGGPALAYALALGVLCLGAEIFIPYHRYAGYLKLFTFVLLVYVAVAFAVEVLVSTLLPSFALGRDEILMVVAVFGTTISPICSSGRRRRRPRRLSSAISATAARLARPKAIISGKFRSTRGSAWPSPIRSASSSW